MNKMKLSLVVPCYNEEENIRDFYHAAKHVFDAEEYEYEIVFINDGSRDKTQEALESVFNLHEACVVVETFSRNFGKEAAIYAGFQKATGDFITVIDADLQQRPETVARMVKILQDNERIKWFAAKYANAHDVFFVGRGVDYAVCLEGSLKLKEISYIHSEAYAAGELKHGTISLIEDNILVIGVLTQSKLYEKTVSNMMECKSRGAYLMGVTNYGNYEMEDKVDFTVYVPKVDEHFMGSLAVIPLQLLGYYVSVAKGLDVDKPRNLAKSVTVE